jgi:hypothetical protein
MVNLLNFHVSLQKTKTKIPSQLNQVVVIWRPEVFATHGAQNVGTLDVAMVAKHASENLMTQHAKDVLK